MAHEGKKGFLASLFGKKRQNEEDEAAQLELKHKLEERIREVLAERAPAPVLLTAEEKQVATAIQQEEEVEAKIELLPISASVVSIRKAPVQSSFVVSGYEAPRSYAANDR